MMTPVPTLQINLGRCSSIIDRTLKSIALSFQKSGTVKSLKDAIEGILLLTVYSPHSHMHAEYIGFL